ncbi:glycosyltransferase [Solibacillus merdavium]|uniref:Glycosyltransferase n=1 Tax=Solibacillus merdavium TaxID=2762218 RepID=A0ABR8XKU9_9BACL|nr:glycosyltransferase [Solibacillus merdavium]MBD8032568.1 glycosyltransferase [Solibacillus merdavium]
MKKILYVYKWATMGGVERVLLNRALAFKEANYNVSQDVFFLHDSGGKILLNQYIKGKDLGGYLQIVETFNPNHYDFIHVIDTPEIFEMTKNYEKIVFECHTAYTENRQYLSDLPFNIKNIIVPSDKFKEDIINEIPEQLQKKTIVLRNFVPALLVEKNVNSTNVFPKIPIAYIGRIDKLKNVEEVIEIFVNLQKKVGDKFILIIAGPITTEVDLFKIISDKCLLNRVIYLPPIAFEKVPQLFNIIKNNNGIVISSSKGESFGLSIAEAIVNDIPILASNIHNALVDNDSTFLYELNSINEATNKIKYITENFDICKKRLGKYKSKLTDSAFLKDWDAMYG